MLSKRPHIRMMWLFMAGLTLALVAAACSSDEPAPVAAPTLDTAAIQSAVQSAVEQSLPEPAPQVSASEIQKMVETAVMDSMPAASPAFDPAELQKLVEQAVSIAAPAGADAKEISAMVEAAVMAASADSVNADDLSDIVAMAVADAATSSLSADQVQQIVSDALAASAAAEQGTKDVIRFHDGQWQSLWINNALAMYVIENGYGYPVESIEGTTVTMQVALPRGDLDVNMEMWRVNRPIWVDEQVSLRKIVDLGQIFEFQGQGWYVPTYMIEGDADRGIEATAPDLKTVADLVKYKDLFADPEDSSMGLFVNCIIGWNCQLINRIKMNTYMAEDGTALSDHFNIIEPGAAAGIDAAIAGAYNNGEPVFSYYWEPTWVLGTFKMTRLEEPAYTAECGAALAEAFESFEDGQVSSEACAFEGSDVHKFVHSDLIQRAPDVVAFLSRMFVGTQKVNELAAYMDENELTAEEVAVYYLTTFEDDWRGWVSDEIFFKVKGSLQ